MSTLTKLKEDPALLETLRKEIEAVSGAVRRMLAGPLKRRALTVLIKDCMAQSSGIGVRDIDAVIDVISDLDSQ